jgi:hypothetical protein
MIQNPNPTGIDARGLGPFIIAQIHVNGTVTIEHLNNLYASSLLSAAIEGTV